MSSHNTFEPNNYRNAASRWSRLGPYYAMFPINFAVDVVKKYSLEDDWVLDPFAGRATSIYTSAALGRHGLGIEIFPVGWIYGKAKLEPAPQNQVVGKLNQLVELSYSYKDEAKNMPEFFRNCFSVNVLCFLLSTRNNLHWSTDSVDTTLMAFILLYLHGKIGEGLSNQMRQTKAMSPEYSVNWWRKNNYITPPEINCREFLSQRIIWRYKYGIPNLTKSEILLGDSSKLLPLLQEKIKVGESERFSLLFTSPPYYNVTNYFNDQWLRLWLLGGDERPKGFRDQYAGKFSSMPAYKELLNLVFGSCAQIMSKKSVVYVRTDARDFTFKTTLSILKEKFPGWAIQIIPAPVSGKTQTDLFFEMKNKVGEMDIVLQSP